MTEVYTVEEAARELKLSRSTIYRFIRSGELAVAKVGRSTRICRADLTAFILSRRVRMVDDGLDVQFRELVEADALLAECATAEQKMRRQVAFRIFKSELTNSFSAPPSQRPRAGSAQPGTGCAGPSTRAEAGR